MDFSYHTAINKLYNGESFSIIQQEVITSELEDLLKKYDTKLAALLDYPSGPFKFSFLKTSDQNKLYEWHVYSGGLAVLRLSLSDSHNIVSLLLGKNNGIFILERSVNYLNLLEIAITNKDIPEINKIIRNRGGENESRLLAYGLVLCIRHGIKDEILYVLNKLSELEGPEFSEIVEMSKI